MSDKAVVNKAVVNKAVGDKAVVSRRSVLGVAGGGLFSAGAGLWGGVGARAADVPADGTAGNGNTAPVKVLADRWAAVPPLSAAPTIDGNLDDSVWMEAAELTGFRSVYTNEPVEDGPTYKIGLTPTHLVLGGRMRLSVQESLAHIEVLLSIGPSGNRHFVAVVPVNRERPVTTEWDRSFDPKPEPTRVTVSSVDSAQSQDAVADEFVVEMAIPLAEIDGAEPSAGDEWRINVIHFHNVNTRPMISWYPILTSRYMDRSGGTVSLFGQRRG